MDDTRIRSEAAFQDARALGAGAEPRDKYYFLADRAYAYYRATLGDVSGKRALVVGCAEGGVTPLARAGATVVGIDIAAEALGKLQRAIVREGLEQRARVELMNAEEVAFPEASFDLICCSGVLHHLNAERAVRSWARVLEPGGALVMIEPMAWNPAVALYRWLTPGERTADEHPLKRADVRLLRTFFRHVCVRGFVLLSVIGASWAFSPAAARRMRPAVRLIDSIDDLLLRVCPALTYCCWTAVIRCEHPIRR